MPFDPETAFAPVSIVADMSMLVVVHPKVEAATLKDFVALARSRPEKINFGSPGWAPPATSGWRCSCTRPASAHPRSLPRGGAGGERA
jgi:tripartite-type tricarboxylate transporter receptor subunit TctC